MNPYGAFQPRVLVDDGGQPTIEEIARHAARILERTKEITMSWSFSATGTAEKVLAAIDA